MAWWRARVVAPARRAWLAVVAARVRRRTGKHPFTLYRDFQCCIDSKYMI
jgi:hypothetical protein